MGTVQPVMFDMKPPQQAPDLLGEYGKLQALRQQQAMAPLQQQAAQQQVQSGGLELQQRQQDLKDQQGISKWFMSIDPKDPDAFNPVSVGKTLASQGVSGKGIMAAQGQLLQHQQTALTMTKDQLANQQQMADSLYSGINGVIGVTDPNQRAQLIAPLLQQAVQAKALQPMQAQQMAANPSAITDDQLKAMQHGLGVSSAFLGSVARMQTAQSGQQRENLEAPGQAAQAQSLVLKNAAQQLAASPDQASYQAALGELPMKIAKSFPQQFDKNAVLQVGMAPNEQTEAGQRAQTLQQGNQRLGIEGANLQLNRQKAGIDAKGAPNATAQSIASGHIVPERMSYLLSRNPELMNEVMTLDPSFDSSKAQAYPQTYKDFTSGKTSVALNSGGTALTHLKELNDMNTVESHIPGTPDYNAYQNKADTVASELAKFYGDSTIPAIATIKKTLTSQLPGTRKAAIQTQAQSMGDKLDSFQQTWDNAAPSAAYQKPMPGISQKAMAARAALDPKYQAPGAAQQSAPQQGAPQGGQQPNVTPGAYVGQIKRFPNGATGVWDGKGYAAQ